MLKNAFKMARSSFRLLMRNKGFIVIGLIIPIAATLFINIWSLSGVQETTEPDKVVELETMDTQIAYMSDYNCLAVKVYDISDNEFTRSLCEKLTRAGLFQIFHADCADIPLDEITADAKSAALSDKIGAVLILSDNESETKLYKVGDDDRFELFEDALELCYNSPVSRSDSESVTTYINVSSDGDVDYYETRRFSYCLSIASLAFIFGGVMILGTIISEKQDNVYSRIMLTSATRGQYILSKALLCIGLSLFQTVVMAVCFVLFVKADVGINVFQFALMLFLNGVIFSTLAVCAGLFVSSTFGAAFLSFSIWSISTLLSGMYFDIGSASELYRKTALAFPQRWTMICTQKLMNGDNSAYAIILCVTAAYLTVILVAGIIGLKLNEEE